MSNKLTQLPFNLKQALRLEFRVGTWIMVYCHGVANRRRVERRLAFDQALLLKRSCTRGPLGNGHFTKPGSTARVPILARVRLAQTTIPAAVLAAAEAPLIVCIAL